MRNPKRLVRAFLREHWRLYALTTLSILASEAVAVQFPRLLGRFTDALQAGVLDARAVARYALWLAVVGAGSVVLFGLGQQGNGQLGRTLEYQLRRQLFAHWERLAVTAFYRRPIGDLLNHALNDVRAVREAFAGGMNNLTNAVFLLVAALWMMVQTVPWSLLAVSLLPLLLIPACVVYWGPRIRAATRQAQEALSSMSDLAEESFSAIRLVKATASEMVEYQRFTERVDEIVRRQLGIFRQ
ncbi:MAG: ABC transporter ATP-binding protein, partial [Alicyclobacillus sp.]|nr:ABC transporter ATP-binding protein [Alicyclobacillus sp.]